MKIDVHSHIIPRSIIDGAAPYGPQFFASDDGHVMLGAGPFRPFNCDPVDYPAELPLDERKAWAEHYVRRFADPDLRLHEMDEQGIDKMVVAMSPLFFFTNREAEIAIPFQARHNDALAEYCATDPGRLFFMASLPLQDVEESVKELDRAIGLGARALNMPCCSINGTNLDDERWFPIWERCEADAIPLFLHPEPSSLSRNERLSPAENILDYVYQDTLAPIALITGGVFDAFPGLNAYLTHGSGFLPYQFGRFEAFSSLKGKGWGRHQRPIREYLSNLYTDVLIHDLPARQFMLDFYGADNVVMGSNYAGTDASGGFELLDEMELPADVYNRIAGENAVKLFNLC